MASDTNNAVQVEELPPPETVWSTGAIRLVLDTLASFVGGAADRNVPLYKENMQARAQDFPEVQTALAGSSGTAIRQLPDHRLVLSAAVPVQHYQRVMGALMATEIDEDVNKALLSVRLTILQVFAVALAITLAMSFYLAGTIARPIRQLALAAERVRRSQRTAARTARSVRARRRNRRFVCGDARHDRSALSPHGCNRSLRRRRGP